jgi:TPP-dependent pyruvate/acetoin dehydrogenase alpha subunit
LIERNLADANTLKQIEAEVDAEMQAAVDFAIAAPYPSPDQVEKDIYA